MARIARAHGVNANQVFQWRRLYRAGRLGGTPSPSMVKLLPVTVEALTVPSAPQQAAEPAAIHIKLGHAQIRVEGIPDVALLRVVLESLRG